MCHDVALFAVALLAVPLAAEAQQAGKIWRIGALFPIEPASPDEPNIAAFRRGLRDLGYVEGQTVLVEYRHAHGRSERFRELAAELIHLKVDVIVVGSFPAALAVKSATVTIPIVFVGVGDPVVGGLVASLARPGANLTGFSFAYSEGFGGKWVELLREGVPGLSRVAVLSDPTHPLSAVYRKDMETAARAFGVKLLPVGAREADQLEDAFAAMMRERVGGLIVDPVPILLGHDRQIVELAARHRLPAIYTFRRFVDAGGLMSYGASLPDLWHRASTLVGKVLKGAKPAELPVEQPTKFEFVINLRTAKILGLTIPQSLLLRADELIQ